MSANNKSGHSGNQSAQSTQSGLNVTGAAAWTSLANGIGKRFWPALLLIVMVPSAVNLLVHLVSGWWIADMFVHFRIHYLVFGFIGFALALWCRRRWFALLAATAIALNIMPVYRYFNPPNTATAHSESVTNHPNRLRIASLNLFSKNRRYNQVADWIRRTNPDIVVLIEAMPRWQRELKKRLPQYPVHKLIRRPSVSGKLILSKIPLEQIQLLPAGRTRSPTPLVTATYGQSSFRFAAIHASWPMTWTGARDRNQELKDLARVATAQPTPMIAVGDFNVTPFSEHYIALRKRSGLRRASAGRGWLPTWPTFFLPVGIQIDHILVSPQIQVLGYWSGSVADSDHCWVMADLLLPASPAPASGTD